MKTLWLEAGQVYDGSQLRGHWILRQAGICGDALVAFLGPCAVVEDEMADLEDLLAGVGIRAEEMLHFLMEVFDDGDLLRAVYRQRLLVAQALELLLELAPGQALRRQGDDLYRGEGKLSVSIATRSPVSTLVHLGLNVSNLGTPAEVQTACLQDLGLEPKSFAEKLLSRAAAEDASVLEARAKVRAKGEARD